MPLYKMKWWKKLFKQHEYKEKVDFVKDIEAISEFIDDVERENIRITIDRIFKLDEIVEAHKYMESNQAIGKIVIEI